MDIRISDHLPKGRENAVSRADIQAKLFVTKREFEEAIQRERLEGSPILTGEKGAYYLATDSDEVLRYARALRRRSETSLKVAKALETPILEERRKRFAREYNAQ